MSTRIVATAFGGPEVLETVEYEMPAPGPGEVALKVRAAGVNPIDHKLYSGQFGTDSDDLPMPLGFEVAGVVTAVGDGASGPRGPVSVGDEVIAYGVNGGYADELVVSANAVVPKPTSLDWAPAAGLMLAGVTAFHAVTVVAPEDGDTVLIHSGAGGVGIVAVQLAVARGARVIATASARNHDFLRELGAEPVAYGDGLVERVRELAPNGVDAAIDLYGDDSAVDTSLALVSDRTRIVTVAGFERAQADGFTAIGSGPGADPGTELRAAARLELVDLVDRGDLEVVVDSTYPLREVAAAHTRSIDGHVRGKIVLVP
ncbi:NADP-dependent oxidoreductase [Nocardioidaceae bacterium SCSIO 66511]|nr:NADP-dependent oxidoreductase [Nocardioidaceae bacterium SCSIO 66511]